MKRSNKFKHFGYHETILDRCGRANIKIGISWFQSTESGGSVEAVIASKQRRLPKRATFVRPRAREGRDIQQPRDAR